MLSGKACLHGHFTLSVTTIFVTNFTDHQTFTCHERRNVNEPPQNASIGILSTAGLLSSSFSDKQFSPEGFAKMERRKIPSTGESIPVVGLGTWRTFNVESAERRKPLGEVTKVLVSKGASVIDSSPMYGASEATVGDLSSELNVRKSLFLATKVWTSGRQDGIEQMNASFRKMRTKVMDLMQVHNLVDVQTHLKILREWKEQGRIRYFGITHYMASAYPEMMRLIKNEKPDFVQFNYNISSREADKELLPFAKDNGIAVIINRPFEEGQLFPVVSGKSLPSWAADYDIKNWAQYFLKFVLSHPSVTCTIPGTSKAHHLEENIGAAFGRLPDETGRQKMVEYFNAL